MEKMRDGLGGESAATLRFHERGFEIGGVILVEQMGKARGSGTSNDQAR